MVEVFKTNVQDQQTANWLIARIHQTFAGYKASFDLEDCDKILRIECKAGPVLPVLLINLLNRSGFQAEVLPDEVEELELTCIASFRKD